MSAGSRLGPLVLSLAACAEVLDIPDDPELVASGPWRCLEQPEPERAPAAASALVQVAACDFASECSTSVTGLRARLCPDAADPSCNDPISADIVDEGGLLSFTVPTTVEGFAGYLEVDSAREQCDNPSFGDGGEALCQLAPGCDVAAPDDACEVPLYVRAVLFFDPPIVHDTAQPLRLPLLPSAALPAWLAAAGLTPLDPATGHLFITALDCDGAPAAGVSFRIDRDEDRVTQLYVAGGDPNDTASQTGSAGMGQVLGVPPGLVTVTASNAEPSDVGTTRAFADATTISYGFVLPRAAALP